MALREKYFNLKTVLLNLLLIVPKGHQQYIQPRGDAWPEFNTSFDFTMETKIIAALLFPNLVTFSRVPPVSKYSLETASKKAITFLSPKMSFDTFYKLKKSLKFLNSVSK